MGGDGDSTTIGVLEVAMAALLAYKFKPVGFECEDELPGRN